MVAKIRQSATDSPNPKPEVGEIDTSPPFQSVKDAVSLFGEGAFSGSGEKPILKKAKPYSAERVLAKETQLHVAQKELNKLKEQVKNAETTKAQALVELERAQRTVDDLTQKLKVISESRELAIKATEAAKSQAKQLTGEKYDVLDVTNGAWKEELESAVKSYASVITELDAAKQELRKIRQERDSSLDARLSAFNQATEAEDAMKENTERASELSKEISAVKESIEQAKLASIESQQQQAMILADKDVLRQSYKATLEQSEKNLLALKKEFNPELTKNLEVQLAETVNEIGVLQKELENKRTSDLDVVKSVTFELDDAKESLQKVADEESSLRSLVETLKVELENVKREHSELKEKESETESIVGNLHVKLRKSKSELEACLAEEFKVRGASEEMILTLSQLTSEAENARREAEDMENKTAELKKEAEVTMLALEDAEKKLQVALEEAEAAKAAEASALDQITVLTERTTAARASTSEHGAKIAISKEEFESLSRKVEESDKLTDMKVAAAKAQVEAVKASENEALKRLETTQKEIEDMKTATQEALKKAEMAEAAKRAVESELRRWREREQKKAAEAASRILAETQVSLESSPQHYRIQKQNPPLTHSTVEVRKLEKEKVSVSKKVLLPNISGIFHRKKNQIEGGSPSYLPGENPV
ncbi:WEB family protein At5g55860 [Gastrolobium bilobum]|uniref:WEB family protein At5g55860 n=1 Tax=Gastrolobium bilobum TaxID=150636 RepID=UPI002AB17A9A|nr:WEB family protein At5g55860 [Gastrolobium bilobum]